jgi:hypothetical protein
MPRMSQRRRNGCKLATIIGLTFAALAPALAQQPSSAQLQAVRSSCRSDFISHCSGVQPGGRDALECLMRNSSQLSAACGRAVAAIVPKSDTAKSDAGKPDTGKSDTPAAQTPQPSSTVVAQQASTPQSAQDQLAAVGRACTLDDASHCSWIKSDNPELLLCLKANAAQLSQACQSVVLGTTVSTPVEAGTPTPPPTEVATPKEVTTPKETKRPSSKQTSEVKSACRSDFIAHCRGVQPGGRSALQCLERNASALSGSCRSALAALKGGAPKETADTGSSDQPAAATPKAPTSQQQSAIRAACRSDFISNCSGVQPGGSAALQCLKSHASSLSQGCQGALAAVGGGGGTETSDTSESTPAAAPSGGFGVRRLPLREELAIIRICAIDRNTLCGGMSPGGGRILMCLAQNASQLSPRCKSALAMARGG